MHLRLYVQPRSPLDGNLRPFWIAVLTVTNVLVGRDIVSGCTISQWQYSYTSAVERLMAA
jgi:hypothetical protein